MEVEILSDRENPLLGRREVRFRLSFQGTTPSRQDVRGKVVALLNSDKELTVLDMIKTDFGSNTAIGYVKVYANKESMRIEPAYRLRKNFGSKEADKPADAGATGQAAKEEAKKEEKKAKAKKEEAPKEESKEKEKANAKKKAKEE